jgi:hypothetical protein
MRPLRQARARSRLVRRRRLHLQTEYPGSPHPEGGTPSPAALGSRGRCLPRSPPSQHRHRSRSAPPRCAERAALARSRCRASAGAGASTRSWRRVCQQQAVVALGDVPVDVWLGSRRSRAQPRAQRQIRQSSALQVAGAGRRVGPNRILFFPRWTWSRCVTRTRSCPSSTSACSAATGRSTRTTRPSSGGT